MATETDEQIAIDRTAWTLQAGHRVIDESGTHYAEWKALVDGHEAGQIWTEDGDYRWEIDNTPSANPFSEDPCPSEPTLELAYLKVQEAWKVYWEFCGSCGAVLTDEDRRWLLAHQDGLDAYCADCREGDCE